MVSLGSLVTEIISSARPRFSKSLLLVVSAALAAAVLCWGCGEEAAGDPKILTVVRVEEKLPDGTWAPVSGADVYYEIYASRATDGVHIPIYQEYADTTDEWGLSAMLRDPDGKNPGDIGLVFIDVTHPGGRTLFRKWEDRTALRFLGVVLLRSLETSRIPHTSSTESAIPFPGFPIAKGLWSETT